MAAESDVEMTVVRSKKEGKAKEVHHAAVPVQAPCMHLFY
jgi:hypothetical protein